MRYFQQLFFVLCCSASPLPDDNGWLDQIYICLFLLQGSSWTLQAEQMDGDLVSAIFFFQKNQQNYTFRRLLHMGLSVY